METRRPAARLPLLNGALLDGRHLARSLRRSPGFATAVILTLALGIGATTAVLSVADHVLVRSLPFRDADRLLMLLEADGRGGYRLPSAPTVADWRQDPGFAKAVEGVTYVRGDGVSVRIGGEAENAGAAFVGPDFFPLLGSRPHLGRLLVADDHRDATQVAVISHRLWLRRFGGDRTVIGRRMLVDSVPTMVVGVLPVGAVYPGFADVWQPISIYRHPDILRRRGFHADSRTLARLRPGVDSAGAAALMQPVGARLGAAYPAEQAHWAPAPRFVRDEIIGSVGPMLWTFAAAAGAILLLACANVASLLLARVASRTKEITLRHAIGASHGRLARQLLTESAILATAGGVLGASVALVAVRLSKSVLATRLPRIDELGVDWRVLAVAAGATALTTLACGLWPALRAAAAHGGDALRAGALGSVGGRGESRGRRGLVAVQFALALVLLVSTGLLVQSFRRASAVHIGFDPRGVVAVDIRPPSPDYAAPEQAAALYTRLMAAASAVPGVVDAAFINHVPYMSAAITTTLSIDGVPRPDSSTDVFYRTVSSGYLRTMRMSMASGRWFDDNDLRNPGGSFVVNQTLASQFWPGATAVGRRITVTRASQARKDFGQPLPGTIIGVLADVRHAGRDIAPAPEVYVPYTVEPWAWGSLVVRVGDRSSAVPALTRAIRSVDSRLIAEGAAGTKTVAVIEDLVRTSLQPRTFSIKLIGVFSAVALLLAAIGLYGVVAYGVTQRTREIGVRKALGATNGAIASLIFRESAAIIAVGTVVGVAGVWMGARLIRSLLFDTSVADVAPYAIATGLLTTVALVATYIPARRAAALDPAIALRGD